MDIHKIVEATLQVTEEEIIRASEPMAAEEPMVNEPAADVAPERPEITPELIAQLIEEIPELAECDQEMLIRGMTVEMEHYDTVGGDIHIVAKVAPDHIKEFPGQDYYAALEQMEAQLKETPAEEEIPAEREEEVVRPGGEATQTPSESPFESVKECGEPEDDEQSAAKKAANKKEEDKINKEEADK